MAQSFSDLANVALKVVARLPAPVGIVCGVITAETEDAIRNNRKRIRKTIFSLQKRGNSVLNHMPFEMRGRQLSMRAQEFTPMMFLEGFYLPILKSRYVKDLYLLPGWEDSAGAKWKHDRSRELGLRIHYLQEKESPSFVHAAVI